MTLQVFLLFFSLYALAKSADVMIAGTQVIGLRYPSIQRYIGYILGSLTSLPELAVTLASMATGHPDVAIMNIVASNAVNVLFMMLQAYRNNMLQDLFHAPFWDEWIFTILGILLPLGLFISGVESSIIAGAGLCYFFFFAWWERKQSRKVLCEVEEPEESNPFMRFAQKRGTTMAKLCLIIGAGLIGITLFGTLFGHTTDTLILRLTETFPFIAVILGIIAGVGTSLPEFQSFGATFRLYAGTDRLKRSAGAQSCLDNCNASSGFNYGVVFPIGVFGSLLF